MFIEAAASTADQSGATFSATRPANGQNNLNLLLAFQSTSAMTGAAPATPTGWTLQDKITFNTNANNLACYYKVWFNEPASYTFNNDGGGAGNSNVWIISIAGAGMVPEQNSQNSGTGTTATGTGFTTTNDSDFLFLGTTAGGLGTTITPQASMNDFTKIGTTGAGLDVAWEALAAKAATGNRTAALGSSQVWATLLVAIFPQGGAPNPGGPSSTGQDPGLPVNRQTNRPFQPNDRMPSRRTSRRYGF